MEYENLLSAISDIKSSVTILSNDMQDMKGTVASLSNDMRCVKLTIENDIVPRISTMEECFLSTYSQLPDYMKKTEQHEVKIDMLQKAIQKHSLKLQNIS